MRLLQSYDRAGEAIPLPAIHSMVVARNRSMVLTSHETRDRRTGHKKDATVQVYDASSGFLMRRVDVPSGIAGAVDLNPSGEIVAILVEPNVLEIIRIDPFERVNWKVSETTTVVKFLDDTLLAVLDAKGASIVNVKDGMSKRLLEGTDLTRMEAAKDGRLLLLAKKNGDVDVVDWMTNRIRRSYRPSVVPVKLCSSSTGCFVAIADSANVEVLDARSGECLIRTEGVSGFIEAIAFSDNDGALVISTSLGIHTIDVNRRSWGRVVWPRYSMFSDVYMPSESVIVGSEYNDIRAYRISDNKEVTWWGRWSSR